MSRFKDSCIVEKLHLPFKVFSEIVLVFLSEFCHKSEQIALVISSLFDGSIVDFECEFRIKHGLRQESADTKHESSSSDARDH